MSIEQYRLALQRELQEMKSSATGKKTWTAQDVAAIMKGQTDKAIALAMKNNTPKEYAELLSM